MIPALVQHIDVLAWGEDSGEFDHLRFAREPELGYKRPNRVAFRAFGGGYVLCTGRYFANIEIMALAALMAVQFDVIPVTGKWVEPTWNNSPLQAGFPVPDQEIDIELWPRHASNKWNMTFSGSEKAIEIVSEDFMATEY